MDILTQGILGSVVGGSVGYKRLGKKSFLWGAVGGIIPDLDMLYCWYKGAFSQFIYHRGVTHSLLFSFISGPSIGYLLYRAYGSKQNTCATWLRIITYAIVTHPLLDIFTSYGTQLFWPFSNYRVRLDSISVVDPLYTFLLSVPIWSAMRKWRCTMLLSRITLILTTCYLVYGVYQHHSIVNKAHVLLSDKGVALNSIKAIPTLGQRIYWRILACDSDGGYWITHICSASRKDEVEWNYFAPYSLPLYIKDTEAFSMFQWFTGGDYYCVPTSKGIDIYDLRYGSIAMRNLGLWGMRYTYSNRSFTVFSVVRPPLQKFLRYIGR